MRLNPISALIYLNLAEPVFLIETYLLKSQANLDKGLAQPIYLNVRKV